MVRVARPLRDLDKAVLNLRIALVLAGVGGLAMGWWMDQRGVMQPVLFWILFGAGLRGSEEL